MVSLNLANAFVVLRYATLMECTDGVLTPPEWFQGSSHQYLRLMYALLPGVSCHECRSCPDKLHTLTDSRHVDSGRQVGIHSVSADGRTWSTPQIAYTLFANWSGSVPQPRPQLGRREAPQMLLSNDGQATPVALFNAAMPCKCGCVYTPDLAVFSEP